MTKILSFVALLLFGGVVYGAFNYLQSDVPPQQKFLLQSFEETLDAANKKEQESSSKEFEAFKYRLEAEKRGLDYLAQAKKVQALSNALRTSLDSLFAINATVAQINNKTAAYKKQIWEMYKDPYDQKELDGFIDNLLHLKSIQQFDNYTSVAQKQLLLYVSSIETAAMDKFWSKMTIEPIIFDPFQVAVQRNATELSVGDTVQLKIYLAARSILTKFHVIVDDKALVLDQYGMAHYQKICNKVGNYHVKGLISPPACAACMKKTYPFDFAYSVAACR